MFDRLLIVSDMDGTLLNHHDYQFEAVLPMLAQLQHQQIPVILNTSKTFAEVESWLEKLDLKHPFIVENGSAIFIPKGYFPDPVVSNAGVDNQSFDGYQVILLGESIVTLAAFLLQHKPEAIDFSRCSAEQAMQLTGLNQQQVAEAQNRQFSIPLSFSDSEQEQHFADIALQSGLAVLKGGRFLHILGKTDKGLATRHLKHLYESAYNTQYGVIALGDSPNDEAMLVHSDIAVVINSPSSDRLKPSNEALIRTQQQAPLGWVEGVQSALKLNQQQPLAG
jgi:mannosyl-3-phosphoglycerate phosphatase family protein